MRFTKAEVFSLPFEDYCHGAGHLCNAIFNKFACGVTPETAQRILDDYHAELAHEAVEHRAACLRGTEIS